MKIPINKYQYEKLLSKNFLLFFIFILCVLFFSKTAFAAWDGNLYQPGEIDNPECLPSQINCDVVPALTSFNELDPTISAWAKAATKPDYDFSEIGTKPTTLSGFGITDAYPLSGNPSGFLTSFAELDPLSLKITNNLSDISDATTTRTNLGLGTLAIQSGTFSGDSSGINTGDQVGDGVTVTGTGTVTDPFVSVSGGGTPGGTDTQIQYNSSGAFAGDSGLVYKNGNVGIGTASPTQKLVVNGSIVTVGAELPAFAAAGSIIASGSGVGSSKGVLTGVSIPYVAGAFGGQVFGYMNQSNPKWLIGLTRNNGVGAENNLTYMEDSAAAEARFTIAAGGNIGIGITNPTHQLQLSKDDAAKPGTNTWTISSDARVKNVNGKYTDGLDTLLKINPIKFNYNGLTGLPIDKEYIGVLAQDINTIPELAKYTVGTYMAKLHPDDAEETQLYDFNSSALAFTTINAIKDIDLKITGINTMEKTNNWRDSLIGWFGNIENSISDLYAKVIHSDKVETKELCVGNVCVTESKFLQMVNSSGAVQENPTLPTPSTPPADTPPPTTTPDTIDTDPIDTIPTTTPDTITPDPITPDPPAPDPSLSVVEPVAPPENPIPPVPLTDTTPVISPDATTLDPVIPDASPSVDEPVTPIENTVDPSAGSETTVPPTETPPSSETTI